MKRITLTVCKALMIFTVLCILFSASGIVDFITTGFVVSAGMVASLYAGEENEEEPAGRDKAEDDIPTVRARPEDSGKE